MKLREILKENFEDSEYDSEGYFVNESDISKWLGGQWLNDATYEIAKDLSVRILLRHGRGSLLLNQKHAMRHHDKLPVKFSEIQCSVKIDMPSLTTLRGMPEKIGGSINLEECRKLITLNGMPNFFNGYVSLPPALTSLEGIGEIIKDMKVGTDQNATLYANFDQIKSGGLGILNIKNLMTISDTNGSALPMPFQIINRCTERRADIFDCQSELIEAGFEEYAKL